MQKPEVSILIPVYNRENFIVEAVESACRQTLGNIEIIVVDNCSTDRTHDVARRLAEGDSRIKVYQNAANVGPVLNWQRCISLATADIAKILWSDDWMDPDYLEKTVPMLLANDDVGFVFTAVKIHSGDATRILYDRLPETGLYDLSAFVEDHLFWGERFPSSPGCALFRTRDLRNNLLIDIPNHLGLDYKKYGQGNDLLLYLLCYEHYSRFGFCKEPLSHFRDHPGCLSANENMALYTFDSLRYFVETGKGRTYRDRYYSFLYLWSRSGKGKLQSMVLNDADYNKDWGFMVHWRLKKTAKRLLKQSIKYWNKATKS
jgi:glycosyltransferase involved in cell wall biosynthesis